MVFQRIVLPLLLAASCSAGFSPPKVYIPFAKIQSLYSDLEQPLPSVVANAPASERESRWREYAEEQDHAVRSRLQQGDEDSLANLLLFGTSFTQAPRITADNLGHLGSATSQKATEPVSRILQQRISDLAAALVSSSTHNERVVYMRGLPQLRGFSEISKLKRYLATNLERALGEHAGFNQTLEAASQLDPSENFVQRSTLFRKRGIALDTSLPPNYALELSLREMLSRHLLHAGGVRRVAIVGPGLDFVDKQEGFDFYPEQTLQPFAVLDSLLRLGLSDAKSVEIYTLDISDRVNQHITALRKRALQGRGYTLQLPRDPSAGWNQEVVGYWRHFGDRIGSASNPVIPPKALGHLKVRALRVRPSMSLKITPLDLNVIWQRLDMAGNDGFDLIIGTNIFVYYDVLDQGLAMLNIEYMLKPGGFLLSNNALPETESSHVHAVDTLGVAYSSSQEDGDHIVWYQKQP